MQFPLTKYEPMDADLHDQHGETRANNSVPSKLVRKTDIGFWSDEAGPPDRKKK